MGRFLSKHRDLVFWSHIILTLLLVFVPALLLRICYPITIGTSSLAFLLICVGFCQNIGIIHQLDHTLPRGPRRVSNFVAGLMHCIGGLSFNHARVAHTMHHRYLGTDLDPDRHGYLTTVGLWNRLKYLAFIGPLRARFAPVDIDGVLKRKWSEEKIQAFHARCQKDKLYVIMTHLILLAVLGKCYIVVFAALIFSNIMSNIRELSEHGDTGSAAYVNIKPSLLGVLFFSTPGFWFHGTHHLAPSLHYVDLPVAHKSITGSQRRRLLQRSSSIGYLLFGR